MGEVKISPYSSTIFSICFCRVEEPCLEVMATVFFLPWGQIIRKINFLVWEMSLLHCFIVTKEMNNVTYEIGNRNVTYFFLVA